MSFVRAVNAPTVTAESCLAMLASRVGSFRAWLCSFGVILYLLSYLRNVAFSRSLAMLVGSWRTPALICLTIGGTATKPRKRIDANSAR